MGCITKQVQAQTTQTPQSNIPQPTIIPIKPKKTFTQYAEIIIKINTEKQWNHLQKKVKQNDLQDIYKRFQQMENNSQRTDFGSVEANLSKLSMIPQKRYSNYSNTGISNYNTRQFNNQNKN